MQLNKYILIKCFIKLLMSEKIMVKLIYSNIYKIYNIINGKK